MKNIRSLLTARCILTLCIATAVFASTSYGQSEQIYQSKPVNTNPTQHGSPDAENSSSSTAFTPALGSGMRKEILDAMRVPFERELHQQLIFKVEMLNVLGDWAVANVIPLKKNGKPIASSTGREVAILNHDSVGWHVLKYSTTGGNAELSQWVSSLSAPAGLMGGNPQPDKEQVSQPVPTPSADQTTKELEQREAELNRRAAELDRRQAEIEKKAHVEPTPISTIVPPESSPPSTPAPQSKQQPIARTDEEVPEAVIKQKIASFGEGTVKEYRRGSHLVSTGGMIPAGTELFPVRASLEGRIFVNEDFRFFKDEFGDWKCLSLNALKQAMSCRPQPCPPEIAIK